MVQIKEIKELLPTFLKETTSLLVSVLDLDGGVIHSNSKFREFFKLGVTFQPEFFELFNDLQREEVEPLVLELIGKPNDIIYFSQSHFNSLISWEFSVLKNSEGDFLGILGVGSIKNESEYLSNEIGYKVSVESDIYFQMNSDWEIQFANKMAESFFGTSGIGLINKKIWQVFPDPKIYEYAIQFKKAKETDSITVIDDFISESGKWFQIIIHPRLGWMDIYFKDVSEVQLLGNELGRLELTLDTILNNSEQSYYLMSQDLRIMRFNDLASGQVRQYLGKVLKEGQKFLHFLLPGLEEKVLTHLEDIIAGRNLSFEETIFLNETLEARLFKHEFYPVTNQNKKVIGFIYTNKDIHDSKAMLGNLAEQNNILKEILYSQSIVLRSPLSSILGLLELIDKKQLDKENQKYLSYLKVLAEDLDQIIRKNTKTINETDSI
ncbi:PAS domain-containing protein [Aquiflexum sp. TKW24L]|uniref:PAS domain-containing protein n=1 Tax=Aquiflexum sp. TKW24L TaxID=2942212 RepID=UPI0020C132AD|nr:PAS domain-containing protein [Aquiflexum sp. TKW24L]MCL6261097.1 PAS domain-containing protein [Aquiflexum sp. TKW24L]